MTTNLFDRAVLLRRFLSAELTDEDRTDYAQRLDETVGTISEMTAVGTTRVLDLVDDAARTAEANEKMFSKAPPRPGDFIDEPEEDLAALADQARDAAARANPNGSSEVVALAYGITVLADALDNVRALIDSIGPNEANAFPLDIVRRIEALEGHHQTMSDRLGHALPRLEAAIERLGEDDQKLSDRIANRAKKAAHTLDRVAHIEARLDGLDT